MRPKVLVITPVSFIKGVPELLGKSLEPVFRENPDEKEVLNLVKDADAIFTNPNKSRVFLSQELMKAAPKLKVICTASTGTNHIDLAAARDRGIKVLSLTEERETINRISSTAEHAFALTMAALRKIPQGWESVRRGEWDCEPYIGRQFSSLTVGVVGYGRLGKLYASYAKAFGAKVLAYDPYVQVKDVGIEQASLDEFLEGADIISLHVHVTNETKQMVNAKWFTRMKKDALLVNTSRGDILDEPALIAFLDTNPKAFYATDVLSNETKDKANSLVLKKIKNSSQILITPHVGGMTREGQEIAYTRAAVMLNDFFEGVSNV